VAERSKSAALHLEALTFRWRRTHGFGVSVDSFTVERRERVLILGPSGAGKSTLLNLICGIVAPQSGVVSALGTNIAAIGPADRDRFRAEHYGIIFQMFNLLPYASALDNVLLPLSFAPNRYKRATAKGAARSEAARLLAALGIDKATAGGLAAELSVGQQQRVAASRALIGSPELIIADEPTSALDADTQGAFLELLFDRVKEARATLVMVSHDKRLARYFDRAVHVNSFAKILRNGSP